MLLWPLENALFLGALMKTQIDVLAKLTVLSLDWFHDLIHSNAIWVAVLPALSGSALEVSECDQMKVTFSSTSFCSFHAGILCYCHVFFHDDSPGCLIALVDVCLLNVIVSSRTLAPAFASPAVSTTQQSVARPVSRHQADL